MAGVIVLGTATPVIKEELVLPELPEPPEKTVEELIVEKLPDSFVAIARAESGLNPTAYNPEWHYDSKGNPVCQGSFGLFQIACVNYEGDPTDLYDIDLNIKLAQLVLKEQGTHAWSVCRTKINCNG